MRILITGASGFIGRHLTDKLQACGHRIVACQRRNNNHKRLGDPLESVQLDFSLAQTPSDWLPLLKNIDVVINAVGIFKQTHTQTFDQIHNRTPCALFQACELTGVKRVVQISALGADDGAFSQYHLSKKAADDCLQKLKLEWVIVKPSIVYGTGSSSMNFFKALSSLPFIPVIDGGTQQIQPIHIDDFTHATEQLISSNVPGKATIDLVGPEPITIKEMYTNLRTWLGMGTARFFSVPLPLSIIFAKVLAPFTKSPISPDAIKMLSNGNTASIKPFIDQFGFKPKSFERVLNEQPAQQTDRWHAGLYFLSPLLRYAIAFLWLYTGVISAFVYPIEQSHKMLADVGISETMQPFILYTASSLNILFGILTLISYRIALIGVLQIVVIVFYTIIISIALPEQWIHPFGPISKNIPVIVSIMIMIVISKR